MSIDAEIEVTAINNATSGGMTVGYYGAEVAREYAEKAKDSARAAEEARNLSEAWAESTEAPTGEGTRSSKSWSEVSREWAEGEREPDGVEGARSSKAWNSVARAWAESDEEPDGTEGAKSAKTWANLAGEKAALATAMANEANVSRDSAKECANAARLFESSAENHATIAKQSADRATEKLEAMKVNLSAKADVESPAFTGTPIVPTASGENAEQIANVAYVKESIATQIDALVGGSPDALDTLKELSEALGKETIDTFNTSDTRGSSPSCGTNYQKLGKELMSQDELAVLNGGKCILQLRGVRPFLSDKYDITKHPNYKYLSDANPKNAFDIEKFLSTRLKLRPEEEFEVFDAGAAAGSESA